MLAWRLVLAAALTASAVAQRGAAPDEVRLGGRVTAADDRTPVRNAMVTVNRFEFGPAGRGNGGTTTTDANGRWELRTTPGRYTFRVAKAGFVTHTYGQRRAFGTGKPIEIEAGQTQLSLDTPMTRTGAITGRLMDENGEPLNGTWVAAMRYRYYQGEATMQAIGSGGSYSPAHGGFVDDLGNYRLFDLPPGSYFVGASIDGFTTGPTGSRVSFVQTFFPGTTTPSADQPVQVSAGHETAGIDFRLARVPVVRVSGRAMNALGQPASGSVILRGPSKVYGGGDVRADGTFEIADVPPGEYQLDLEHVGNGRGQPPPGRSLEIGATRVSVNGQDVSGVLLITAPGGAISGRVMLKDAASGPVPSFSIGTVALPGGMTARLMAGGSLGGPGAVSSEGTFTISDRLGPHLIRPVSSDMKGWMLESVRLNGRNITDTGYEFVSGEKATGLEIVLTRATTAIAGTVRDEKGDPVDLSTVVAFAVDPERWHFGTRFVGTADADAGGTFRIAGLPAGEYYVVAVIDLEPGMETDPAVLELWRSRATRVTLGADETKTISLTVKLHM